jgi:hypothetical protein
VWFTYLSDRSLARLGTALAMKALITFDADRMTPLTQVALSGAGAERCHPTASGESALGKFRRMKDFHNIMVYKGIESGVSATMSEADTCFEELLTPYSGPAPADDALLDAEDVEGDEEEHFLEEDEDDEHPPVLLMMAVGQ